MEWGQIAAEMTNKVRWAIGSTMGNSSDFNLSYRDSQALASSSVGEILKSLKQMEERPGLQPKSSRPTFPNGKAAPMRWDPTAKLDT